MAPSFGGIPVFIPRSAMSIPVKYFYLSPVDNKSYWSVLTSALPDLFCYIYPHPSERTGAEPPTVNASRELPVPGRFDSLQLIFEPDWQPEWTKDGDTWRIVNDPFPNGTWDRAGWISPAETDPPRPERMRGGRLYFRCEKNNKEHLARARKCFRLLAKVATNRVQAVTPTLEVRWQAEKGSRWIGHDAARWCRENSKRVVEHLGGGVFLRPLD